MLTPLRIAASSSVDIVKALGRLPGAGRKGKKRVKKAFNGVYARCEDAGLLPRLPDYLEDYAREYPELLALEGAYADIRGECERLLAFRARITDMSKLGGQYTERGIHTIRWKAFMLKSGTFIEENCALAPRTAAVLRPLGDVYNAFFSILEPHQYVTPHWGYYKGFVRYHLGVVIPNDNADRKCWLRVNVDPADNALRDKSLIERTRKFHWRNGRGVIFDDTNLHDAANESDEVRVVLWLDVARRLPRALDLYNRALLKAVYYEPSVRKFRENAIVRLPDTARA
ncbi:MAG: aspartyl/asparaginyl beta-hydroxylase domain-containing protein [Deltaproteobacteria bacterium]|nr:aspartyl/asparaginyl beta-hydroxylase domain-containing protein [Deltaproteobacteria bacterium]